MKTGADDCCGGEFTDWTAIIRWRFTRQWINTHPIGEAILIAVAIDDIRASRVLLEDAQWKHITLTLPKPGSRRVRRVDIRARVTSHGYRRFRIEELKASRDGVQWRPCCFPDR